MATQERDPRPYELMTVFVPELSEDDTQGQIDKVATYIANAGGSLTETLTSSPWGRRRLAYTIRFNGVDYRDGFYTVFHFDSAPSNLTELEREMKLDTSIMRYLLVHNDPKAGEKFTEGEGDAAAEDGEAAAEAAPAEAATTSASADSAAETSDQAPAEADPAEATASSTPADSATETSDQAPAEAAEQAEGTTEPAEAASPTAEATETEEAEPTGEATDSNDTPDKE